MKKLLIYVFAVLLALVIIDMAYGFFMDYLSGRRYLTAIVHTEGANEGLAIFGSSRANHHYDSQLLADSLHLTTYNYGIEGQNIFADEAVLVMLLKHAERKPTAALLDLSEPDICDVPGWNADHLNMLYPYADEPAVDSIFSCVLDPRELFFVRYSQLYRHNSRVVEYAKPQEKPAEARIEGWQLSTPPTQRRADGYSPLQGKWSGEPVAETPAYVVSEQKVASLERFIQRCSQNGISLVMITSPNYKRLPKEQTWVKEVKRLAQEYHIPYLYFEQEEEYLNHPEWFNEPYHLNATGANIYTRKVIASLKELGY